MKKMYVDPEAVVVQFHTEDIITASNDNETDSPWGDDDLG